MKETTVINISLTFRFQRGFCVQYRLLPVVPGQSVLGRFRHLGAGRRLHNKVHRARDLLPVRRSGVHPRLRQLGLRR